jgi:hypothetical protein
MIFMCETVNFLKILLTFSRSCDRMLAKLTRPRGIYKHITILLYYKILIKQILKNKYHKQALY